MKRRKIGINVAIIDADLIGKKNHRMPNLASMKISGFYKGKGANVKLRLDYKGLNAFDKVFISKVFTDTEIINPEILERSNVSLGGTGFYFDKAPPLPYEIEHHMQDYSLYEDWLKNQMVQGNSMGKYKFYTDYSIGYLTRGCFRHCGFCVNSNSNASVAASSIAEFLDTSRKKICLQDDNFLACKDWKKLLYELQDTGKPFQFKQGLDIRILTEEKIKILFSSKLDGDVIFAFDNIQDSRMIERKLDLIHEVAGNHGRVLKLYVFSGFDRKNRWDQAFWKQDIFDCFERIHILKEHDCIPYLTRFHRFTESPYRGMYINLGRWCNQPGMYKKKSFREFCEMNGVGSACYRYMSEFENLYPEIGVYFDMKHRKKIGCDSNEID